MPVNPKRLAALLTMFLTFAVVFVVAAVVRRSNSAQHTPPSPLVGRAAPDFALPDLDGKTVTLSALKGHVVVLDLWATWCQPCVAELPANVAVAKKFADRGVQFYAVNITDTPDAVRDFLDQHHIATSVLFAGGSDVPTKYDVQYIPLLVIIDANGRVTAADNIAPDAVEATLPGWIENALKAGQAA